jgi:type I restriction enzyme S subunit
MTFGLEPYPAMKDSGVSWLGKIPEHWQLRRTKTLLRERVEKGFPNEPLLAATQSKGVVRKDEYENRTVLALKDLHLLKLVRMGDFVISLRSFQGGIEYARDKGIISPAYTILYPICADSHGYLAKLFKSAPYIESLSLYVTGIRQGQNIDYEKLGRAELPLPRLSEQAAIVRFLDHADRRIRRYIRAKQKLIKLLEEQKQAIIHRAVTRGLDPNVRLKPSGVEWLGDVPEHWEVAELRFRYEQCLGKMVDSKKVTNTRLLPYLRNVDVKWDRINTENLPLIDIAEHEQERFTVRSGDLLVCEGRHLGRSAIWRGELSVCAFQKALHRLRARDPQTDAPRYLFYCLSVVHFQDAFGASSSDNSIPHLTGEMLRAFKFPFPSPSEQTAIAADLDAQISRFASAQTALERELLAMREYRTRLIADVVTGKLDVREAAARLPEEVELEVREEVEFEVDTDEADAGDVDGVSEEDIGRGRA